MFLSFTPFIMQRCQCPVSFNFLFCIQIKTKLMKFSVWFGVKFQPSGQSTFLGMLNSFVHVFMYSYYTIATFGPKYQKYIWWKKYLTSFQMVQFILVFYHSTQLFFIDCEHLQLVTITIAGNAILYLTLFSFFYLKTYGRRVNKVKLNELSNINKIPDKMK